jgi:hypothetical protein
VADGVNGEVIGSVRHTEKDGLHVMAFKITNVTDPERMTAHLLETQWTRMKLKQLRQRKEVCTVHVNGRDLCVLCVGESFRLYLCCEDGRKCEVPRRSLCRNVNQCRKSVCVTFVVLGQERKTYATMAAAAAARTPSPTPCLADMSDEQQTVYTLLKVSTSVD